MEVQKIMVELNELTNQKDKGIGGALVDSGYEPAIEMMEESRTMDRMEPNVISAPYGIVF